MDENIHNIILKLLGLLEEMSQEKGTPKGKSIIDKNINKNAKSTLDETKVSESGLSAVEKKKLKETFNLFNEMFFSYQKKHLEDKKEKTLVTDITKKQQKASEPLKADKKKGLSLVDMIIGGLMVLAASVTGLILGLTDFFGNLSGTVKAISKLGFMGALQLMKTGLLKKLSLKVLKRLPVIGGIIGIGYAVKAFREGNIFLGIAELLSGLLNFIPVVGPWLSMGADVLIAWAQAKGMFDEGGALSPENGWNTIKGWMGMIGKVIMDNALYLPIIGTFKRFGMAWDEFKGGNIGEGLKQIGLGLFTIMPGGGMLIKGLEVLSGWLSSPDEPEGKITPDRSWMDRLKGWIKEKLKNLPDWIKAPLKWFGIMEDDSIEAKVASGTAESSATEGSKGIMSYVSGVWDKVKGPMGDAAGALGQLAQDTWTKTKEYSGIAWEKAKEAGSWVKDSMSKMATKTGELINEWIPNIVDTIGNVAESAMNVLKGIATKVGDWIMGLFSSDEQKSFKQVQQESAKKEEMVAKTSEVNETLIQVSNEQVHYNKLIFKVSMEQAKLLQTLVSVGRDSLKELRRMTGNTSGGSSIVAIPSSQSETPMISIPDNRGGYLNSPYSLA